MCHWCFSVCRVPFWFEIQSGFSPNWVHSQLPVKPGLRTAPQLEEKMQRFIVSLTLNGFMHMVSPHTKTGKSEQKESSRAIEHVFVLTHWISETPCEFIWEGPIVLSCMHKLFSHDSAVLLKKFILSALLITNGLLLEMCSFHITTNLYPQLHHFSIAAGFCFGQFS